LYSATTAGEEESESSEIYETVPEEEAKSRPIDAILGRAPDEVEGEKEVTKLLYEAMNTDSDQLIDHLLSEDRDFINKAWPNSKLEQKIVDRKISIKEQKEQQRKRDLMEEEDFNIVEILVDGASEVLDSASEAIDEVKDSLQEGKEKAKRTATDKDDTNFVWDLLTGE
jgi:hypothetical protein